MDDARGKIAAAPFAGAVRLETRVVLARDLLSPAGAEKAAEAGSLALAGVEGGRALLEVGGVAVAEGRVATRRGKSLFRVERMLRGGSGEGSV